MTIATPDARSLALYAAAAALLTAAVAGGSYWGTRQANGERSRYVMTRGDQFTVFRMDTATGAVEACELTQTTNECRPMLKARPTPPPPAGYIVEGR